MRLSLHKNFNKSYFEDGQEKVLELEIVSSKYNWWRNSIENFHSLKIWVWTNKAKKVQYETLMGANTSVTYNLSTISNTCPDDRLGSTFYAPSHMAAILEFSWNAYSLNTVLLFSITMIPKTCAHLILNHP